MATLTKAAAIAAIIAADDDWTKEELATMPLASLRKMADKVAATDKGNEAPSRDDKIAAILDSGKFDMFDNEDLEAMKDVAIDKLHSKISGTSGKVTGNGAPKAEIPTKPKVIASDADLVSRVKKYLQDLRLSPKGTHPFPTNKAGQPWQTSTVHNIVLESLTDLGFDDADKWAALFVEGSASIADFNKVVQFKTLENRLKSTRAKS